MSIFKRFFLIIIKLCITLNIILILQCCLFNDGSSPLGIYLVSAEELSGSVSGPDIVTLNTEYPDLLYIGESFQISDSVMNIGDSAAGIVRNEYFIGSKADGSDGRHLGWWVIQNLKSGEKRSSRETLSIPDQIKTGTYYLTKKITVTSNPPELNKANNFWRGERPVRVEYDKNSRISDLTHISTKFPCINPGSSGDIVDTITNIGNSCAEDTSVAYYISPYKDFDPSVALYLGVWKINKICVGEQITHITHITIPELSNGEYYWFSVIDPCSFISNCGYEMPELDKSNNIISEIGIAGPCVFCNC